MTHQAPLPNPVAGPDPGRQVARLNEALRLIENIAGRPASSAHDDALDQAARISAAFDAALPVVQRRFEVLAAETAVWAAAGVEALLAAGEAAPPRAAAARLADQLDAAIRQMAALLSRAVPSP